MAVRLTMLIVDDDRDDQDILREVIEEINPSIRCHYAFNGLEALQCLANCAVMPDLIFLDLNMPVMSGREFLEAKKAQHSIADIPVYVFTTSYSCLERNSVLRLGATDFLTKPTKYKMLSDVVSKILAKFNPPVKTFKV